jgi:hypothetical protein
MIGNYEMGFIGLSSAENDGNSRLGHRSLRPHVKKSGEGCHRWAQ